MSKRATSIHRLSFRTLYTHGAVQLSRHLLFGVPSAQNNACWAFPQDSIGVAIKDFHIDNIIVNGKRPKAHVTTALQARIEGAYLERIGSRTP